jgi:hypothetical protein
MSEDLLSSALMRWRTHKRLPGTQPGLFCLDIPDGVDHIDWLKACTQVFALHGATGYLEKIFNNISDISHQNMLINTAYEYSIIQGCETTLQWMLQKGYRCNSRVCSVATTSPDLDRLKIFINLLSDPTLENVEFMPSPENENNTQAYNQMLMYLYFAGARLTFDQMTRGRELEIFDILKNDHQSMMGVLPHVITELISKHL